MDREELKEGVWVYNLKNSSTYTILHIAQHSETKEDLVVYQDSKGRIWARPLDLPDKV